MSGERSSGDPTPQARVDLGPIDEACVTLMVDEALAIEPIPMDGFFNDHAATGRPCHPQESTGPPPRR